MAFELHPFTPVRMGHRYSVFFVTVSTTATAGVWALARWIVDPTVGIETPQGHVALMWEFAAATVVGVAARVACDPSVRWWERLLDRLTSLLAEGRKWTTDGTAG